MSKNGKVTGEAQLRRQVLDDFALSSGLPRLQRIVQHGNDPDSVRYTMHFDAGREVRIPSAACLFSQAQLNLRLAAAMNRTIVGCKPAEWRERVGTLVEYGMEIQEQPGERFIDTVAEWIDAYCDRASSDADGAPALRAPFYDEDGTLHLVATELAKYVRRELSEQVERSALYEALSDLGYERVAVNYRPKVGRRSTVSYYRAGPQSGNPQ